MSDAQVYAVGIDIGGTRIKAVAVTDAGELRTSAIVPAEDAESGWKRAVPALIRQFEETLGSAASDIGVSSPGLVRRDHRAVSWMQGRMAGVQDYDWTAALARSAIVPVLNDAHAALLGEAWLGAARGQRDVVMLTLGTGVGGAILCDGRLLEGHLGRAGHVGHISLNPEGEPDIVCTPGSLEDAVGQHSLPRRSNGRFSTTSALLEAMRTGDEHASQIWNASIRALAAGIASIINVIDPAVVVIGGGIAGAGSLLFEPLQREMARCEWRPTGAAVPVIPATLGELAGAFGAARFAVTFPPDHSSNQDGSQ